MATVFTGNYREDVQVARKLGLFSGINPKKEVLYNIIRDYEIDNISEWQKVSESDLADELINACNDSTESDRPVSRLPKPVLKRDRVQKPKPIQKRDRVAIAPNPLKRPAAKPVLKQNRVSGPKPKLGNRFNHNLFQ